MDCGVKQCSNYNNDCFFKTILVKKPDPKTGCSYFRKLKRKAAKAAGGEDEPKVRERKPRSDKGKKRIPRKKKGS